MPIGTISKIEYYFSRLEDFEMLISSFGLIIMTTLVFFNAIGRYFFNSPIPGVVNILELYLMALVVWFMLPTTQREGDQINIDILSKRLPEKVNASIDILGLSLILIILIVASYKIAHLTYDKFMDQTYLLGTVDLPMYVSWGILLVGIGTVCIRIAIDLVSVIHSTRPWKIRKHLI